MTDNITLPRDVVYAARGALLFFWMTLDSDTQSEIQSIIRKIDAALNAPIAKREPATDDQIAEADESHEPSWLDYRDGWREAERFHGIRKEDNK